uniref:Neur_chan_LBD domain-containing protein n=1 Tax=Heterorhabditis bacteriophora TaxID=37862 RepID=A0A1I7XUY2_HETBA
MNITLQVTQPNFLVWIEPDGSILYDTRISMVVVCTLNLEKWPLDSQRCHLRILSYAYTTDQLQIEWVEDTPITRNPNIAMSDMHIVDLFPGLCDGNYSTGTKTISIKAISLILWFTFIRLRLFFSSRFVFGVMIEFTIVNYAQRQVMATSLESMNNKKFSRTEQIGYRARDFLERVRGKEHQQLVEDELAEHIMLNGLGFDSLSNALSNSYSEDETQNPPLRKVPYRSTTTKCSRAISPAISDAGDSPKIPSELWKEKESEKAERFVLRKDSIKINIRQNNCYAAIFLRLANWAVFDEGGGSVKRRSSVWSRLITNGNEKTSPSYGTTTARPTSTLNNTKPGDRWSTAIKQIQKHKKIAGRNRAKRIDQKSRWVFPLSFGLFNLSYWSYYLYFKP